MASATAQPVPQKKTLFDTVVTSTPVLLTVIAAFLLGQSSSEMTQAQYHRALASQNQSKVGDSWGFFQAKRIRGQILEGNADLLLARPRSPFSRASFPAAADALLTELRGAEKALKPVMAGGDALPADVTEGLAAAAGELKALVADADKALASINALLNPPKDSIPSASHVISPTNLQAALDALRFGPKRKGSSTKDATDTKASDAAQEARNQTDPAQLALLKEIISDIKKRKPETEIAPSVIKLDEKTLLLAIKASDSEADEVSRRGKLVEDVLEEFDSLVERQTALAFSYQELAARFRRLADKAAGDPKATAGEAREKLATARAALDRHADAIRQLNAGLQGDYQAARHAFSARRYEDEARSNQESAYLYEVKVLLSSVRSNKHLFRSRLFLFATVIAQAGVTIATLAIAVKRRSIFWLLAALTGLVAVGFGLYVYIDLTPTVILGS
jgi:hypothetical protein